MQTHVKTLLASLILAASMAAPAYAAKPASADKSA
ncbi:glycerophosphoryl diester phosphodiesterase, partial [Yersinia pestis PY-59]